MHRDYITKSSPTWDTQPTIKMNNMIKMYNQLTSSTIKGFFYLRPLELQGHRTMRNDVNDCPNLSHKSLFVKAAKPLSATIKTPGKDYTNNQHNTCIKQRKYQNYLLLKGTKY